MTFSVATTNPAASEPTRTYHHFSDAAADVVNARVYEGIHFRPADVPRGSVENRPTGVTSKPANGVAQDVILIYPAFS